jgi:hypothetical protein
MKTWAKIKDWAAGVLFGEPERVVPNALGSGAAEPRPTRWGQRVPPGGISGYFGLWVWLPGLVVLLGLRGEARAQASAVTAIPFNGTGYVDTTWLGNAAALGNYTFVYQSSGSNSWAISSQSGTLPAGFISPPPAATFGTFYSLVGLNSRHYIRLTSVGGGCGVWGWVDRIYAGPFTNQAPNVSQFSLAPASVPRGSLATVGGNVTDADGNLTTVRIDHLPPSESTWILGTSGAGTAWTGVGVSAQSLSKTFLVPTAGTWTFRLSGTDSDAASSGFTSGTITVADTPYYDPANFHNGVAPMLVVTQGNGLFGVAGQFNAQATVVRVQSSAGVAFAGAPVQIRVASGGGGLAATATGAGASELTLTTNASGLAEFFYRQPTTPYAVSSLRVLSGMKQISVASYSYTAADAAADADGDGLSDATEVVLGTLDNTPNAIESDPLAVGLAIHAPQR